jgi:MinD superfamily P-loop ATPase
MKELVVVSGKGGAGKTALTAALAHQASTDPSFSGLVLVDADVDAANLELVVGATGSEAHLFEGGEVASVDMDACLICGVCQEFCRFDAIHRSPDGLFEVDPLACEGCAACFYQCPVEAIRMIPRLSGEWFRSWSRFGPFVHARLRPAQENSGKLVTVVKENGRTLAGEMGDSLLMVDGPPGIACPAIAAISGADMALLITEPTSAALHDLKRMAETVAHFRLPGLVCVNKADINPEGMDRIEEWCREWDFEMVAAIPFDGAVVNAMTQGKAVTEYQEEAPASLAARTLWQEVKARLLETVPLLSLESAREDTSEDSRENV